MQILFKKIQAIAISQALGMPMQGCQVKLGPAPGAQALPGFFKVNQRDLRRYIIRVNKNMFGIQGTMYPAQIVKATDLLGNGTQ